MNDLTLTPIVLEPSMELVNRLSKSRYTKGLRCPLALYLAIHHTELAGELSAETQARLDAGTRIHELVHGRYPEGVLIAEDYAHFAEALEHTKRELEAGTPALFEPAFCFDNVKIRVDVLRRLREGGFELIEFKSSTKYKPDTHLADAGVQLHVLLGSGIDVRKVTLLHMNRDYVWPGGKPYDLQRLFAPTDITADAFRYIEQVPLELAWMMAMLAEPEPPDRLITVDCVKPWECEFFAYCHADDPVPNLDEPVRFVPEVTRRLEDLRWPLHFVDFETLMPALPVFPGTRPYQLTRVQWSAHTLHQDGTLEHREWLVGDAAENPDTEFFRTLFDALPAEGTFVHYSPYERTQLVAIAADHPELRQELLDRIPGFYATLSKRLYERGLPHSELRRPVSGGMLDFDLGARIVKDGCLHPVFGPFGGGWSIKDAIKVLARDLPPYGELRVGNGDQAMAATAEMLDTTTPPERKVQLRADLLAYCAQDTIAMVRVYESVRKGCAG
jgi:hypothetical protein